MEIPVLLVVVGVEDFLETPGLEDGEKEGELVVGVYEFLETVGLEDGEEEECAISMNTTSGKKAQSLLISSN